MTLPLPPPCEEGGHQGGDDILRSSHGCEWIIASPHAERERLAREAGVTPLLAQLLLNRGIARAADVRPFLAPDFTGLRGPEALPGAVEAGARLAEACRGGRRIVIYGDYDVDGVTATAILWHALRAAGADVRFYIPSRLDEGYGLNADALDKLAADGADVVVTVDCGITARAEARRARELGLELIITDHHQPQRDLPDAAAIVHPSALAPSPNPHLSGAGVAFKVAWALGQALAGGGRVRSDYRDLLADALPFAALGLVADVVPLVGENRFIAHYGLARLMRSTNPGLRALIDVSGLASKAACDDYDVGFRLAPRLNAVGRMGHARLAVELFTRADEARAREIATTLDAQNRQRQEVERAVLKEAEALVADRGYDRDGCRAIVLASPDWHPGVIGIVAARLVDRFHRPTILISLENGEGQGSGRSVRHFPLHEALAECAEYLVSHGGHAMAAGVRLRADQVDAFTSAFQATAVQRLTAVDLRPQLQLDDEVTLAELTTDVVTAMERMAPFGEGNPRPRLTTGVVELAGEPRIVGRTGAHLQLQLRQGATHRKAIAFGLGPHAQEIGEHLKLRVAFEPIVSEWNGSRRVELKVIDWKPAE